MCLQVLFKAPITEKKQVEHVVNERKAGQAAGAHPLCVRLHAAFQDDRCLYLLQDFVPGELPHQSFLSSLCVGDAEHCRARQRTGCVGRLYFGFFNPLSRNTLIFMTATSSLGSFQVLGVSNSALRGCLPSRIRHDEGVT